MRDRRSPGGRPPLDARLILNVKQRVNKRRFAGIASRGGTPASSIRARLGHGVVPRRAQMRAQFPSFSTRPSAGSLMSGVKKLVNFTIVASNPNAIPASHRFSYDDVMVEDEPHSMIPHANRVAGIASSHFPGLSRTSAISHTAAMAPMPGVRFRSQPSSMFMNAMRDATGGLATTPSVSALPAGIKSRLTIATPKSPTVRVLFTNLAPTVSDDDVKELCSTVDDYVSSRLMRAQEAEAFYATAKAAADVVALYNGRMLDGVAMEVRVDTGDGRRPATSTSAPATKGKSSSNGHEMEVDRELITSALFAKRDDKIAFTVKI